LWELVKAVCARYASSRWFGGSKNGDLPASAAATVKAGSKQPSSDAMMRVFPTRTSTGMRARWQPSAVRGSVGRGWIALMSRRHATDARICPMEGGSRHWDKNCSGRPSCSSSTCTATVPPEAKDYETIKGGPGIQTPGEEGPTCRYQQIGAR
jgi:hypothetical protein